MMALHFYKSSSSFSASARGNGRDGGRPALDGGSVGVGFFLVMGDPMLV